MSREPKPVDWRALAKTFSPRTQAFIDGRYVPAISGATFDCVNPANGQVIAKVASCDAADVDVAVASARKAFEAGHWSRRAPAARKKVLLRFAELIRKHREELALTETMDMGKPITDSMKIDIPAAANCIAWYGEAVDKVYDEVAPTSHDSLALITREPAGVVGAIVPWNFPAADGVLEARPGARDRQLRRVEALGEVAAHGAAHRGARDGGGPARGRSERRAGLRQHGGRGARAAHGRRLRRLHRLHPHRQADARVRGQVEHEARLARVRRQGAERRARRRRRPRARGDRRGIRDLLQPGRDVLGGLAPRRARVGARRDAREDRRDRQDHGAGRPARPEDAPRRHRGPGAAQHRHGIHRVGHAGRREGRARRQRACARTAAASTSSRRSSPA